MQTAGVAGTGTISDGAGLSVAYAGIERLSAHGGTAGDSLSGLALDDTLMGNLGDDSLSGGAGNDSLDGEWGADTLNGGAGVDTFDVWYGFDTADVIQDFATGEDVIALAASGFGGGLLPGMDLAATGRFALNLTGIATAPAGIGQFVYETDAGRLWWDADGSGAEARLLVATLIGAPTLAAGDLALR